MPQVTKRIAVVPVSLLGLATAAIAIVRFLKRRRRRQCGVANDGLGHDDWEVTIFATWDVAAGLKKEDYVDIVKAAFHDTASAQGEPNTCNSVLKTCLGRDGHVLFSVSRSSECPTDAAFFTEVVDTVKRCVGLQYFFVRVASTRLSYAELATGDKTDERRRISGLRQIDGAVRCSVPVELPRALALWAAWNGIKLNDFLGHGLTFHVFGRRGGRGHFFSSDELKRTCAKAISTSTPLNGLPAVGAGTKADMSFRAQIHNRFAWLGIQLNHRSLAFKRRPTKTTKLQTPQVRHLGQPGNVDIATTKSAPTTERAGPTTSASAPKQPAESLYDYAEQQRVKHGRPVTVADVVTPLITMPYEEQLERKVNEMRSVYLRLVRRARKAWRRAECSAADAAHSLWLVPEENKLYLQVDPILSATPIAHYRNKCAFSVGTNKAGEPQCGFKLTAQLHAGNDRRQSNSSHRDHRSVSVETATLCSHIPSIMASASDVFTQFIRSSPLDIVDQAAVLRRKRTSRRRTGQNAAQARSRAAVESIGIWSGLVVRCSVSQQHVCTLYVCFIVSP